MPMSPRLLRPRASGPGAIVAADADARAYIAAVNTADGQPLEVAVQQAIDAFIVGCKSDGIWSAIRTSCLLMGARTLSGALTPLAGSAPTNNGPFVSGDYNRKTGLVGDGTAKHLNTNRANNAESQDNHHMGVYLSSAGAAGQAIIGAGGTATGASGLVHSATGFSAARSRHAALSAPGPAMTTGFFGISRANSTGYTLRHSGADTSLSITSEVPSSDNVFAFARNNGSGTATTFSSARLAFYCFGDTLTLSLLDSRVTTLYNAIGAAIP